jgi:hypothetical protein
MVGKRRCWKAEKWPEVKIILLILNTLVMLCLHDGVVIVMQVICAILEVNGTPLDYKRKAKVS